METYRHTMYTLHLWPIWALLALTLTNLLVIWWQKGDRALRKYLRLQAIAWITLMSMIVFTGATYMAFFHVGWSVKIVLMIAAVVALSSLELRRHLVLKRARVESESFEKARERFVRLYLFESLWLAGVGALAPYV